MKKARSIVALLVLPCTISSFSCSELPQHWEHVRRERQSDDPPNDYRNYGAVISGKPQTGEVSWLISKFTIAIPHSSRKEKTCQSQDYRSAY